MTIKELDNRATRSECCGGRIDVVYITATSTRKAVVYTCLQCQRMYVLDSRDEDKPRHGSVNFS